MDITVSHPSFVKRRLVVRTAGLLSGPKVLLLGAPVKRVKGEYVVVDDNRAQVTLKLKINFADPIPVLLVNDHEVRLARALEWYEYAWACIPIVLVFIGGALGGGIGAAGTYTNTRILRSDRGVAAKYLLSGLVTLGAIVAFFVAASMFASVIRPGRAL